MPVLFEWWNWIQHYHLMKGWQRQNSQVYFDWQTPAVAWHVVAPVESVVDWFAVEPPAVAAKSSALPRRLVVLHAAAVVDALVAPLVAVLVVFSMLLPVQPFVVELVVDVGLLADAIEPPVAFVIVAAAKVLLDEPAALEEPINEEVIKQSIRAANILLGAR